METDNMQLWKTNTFMGNKKVVMGFNTSTAIIILKYNSNDFAQKKKNERR